MLAVAKYFQAALYWPVLVILKLLFAYNVEGQANLHGLENTPVIFAANHGSYMDGFLVAAAMPRQGLVPQSFYPLRFLIISRFMEFWDVRMPIAIFTRLSGAVKVCRRGGDVAWAMRGAISALRAGDKVVVFPEGKFTLDGSIGRGRRGVAYLNRETGVPIVPVAIRGHFDVLSTKHLYKRGARLSVCIGQPMQLPPGISLEEGSAMVMSEIKSLRDNPAS